MALTNAERQARHRERMKARLLAAEAAPVPPPAKASPAARDIEALKRKLAKAEQTVEEKEGQRRAQESMANIAERQARDAANRAMFAEADKERMEGELETLREEVERLKEDGDALRNDLLDRMNSAFEEAHVAAVLATIAWSDRRWGEPEAGNPWFDMRARLLAHPGFEPQTPDNWIGIARDHGTKLGEYLSMKLLRDAVAEKVDAEKASKAHEPKASRRKGVT